MLLRSVTEPAVTPPNDCGWTSDYVVCAEIGYTEARAALAAARRNARLSTRSHATARAALEGLWAQVCRCDHHRCGPVGR